MNNLISNLEVLDSVVIYEYNKLEDLIKKAIEYNFLDEENANVLALKYFNMCVEKAKQYSEDFGYIDSKEVETLIQNYLRIIGIYLSQYKNSQALDMIINIPNDVFKNSFNYYERLNLELYNMIESSLGVFEKIGHRSSILLIKRLKCMYKYFTSKLTEIDISSISINTEIVAYEDFKLSDDDIIYSDIEEKSCIGGFVTYIEVAKNVSNEAKFLENFDPKEIKKLLNKPLRKVDMGDGVLTTVPIVNITWSIIKQFLFSNLYHADPKDPLKITESEAKVILWEIMKDLLDIDELFDGVNKYGFSEETKIFILKFKSKLIKEIEKTLKGNKENRLVIF